MWLFVYLLRLFGEFSWLPIGWFGFSIEENGHVRGSLDDERERKKKKRLTRFFVLVSSCSKGLFLPFL